MLTVMLYYYLLTKNKQKNKTVFRTERKRADRLLASFEQTKREKERKRRLWWVYRGWFGVCVVRGRFRGFGVWGEGWGSSSFNGSDRTETVRPESETPPLHRKSSGLQMGRPAGVLPKVF